ncbi:hypothetical protein MFLAVUS_011515 [Mucor flavus]|uniref:Chromo domain-containing protein n=1 Tax=Mucor flavus TaxID=439312 RepID=A0ABP9ZFU1_9FUNG
MIMPRNYTSIELKLISHDEVIALDDEGNEIKNYEVEAILNHRGSPKNIEYLVRWKNYSSDWDEWLPTDHFNDVDCLRKYWKHLGTEYKPKKSNVITNAPSSSKTLQKTKPSTISKLIDTIPLEDNVVDLRSTSQRNIYVTNFHNFYFILIPFHQKP